MPSFSAGVVCWLFFYTFVPVLYVSSGAGVSHVLSEFRHWPVLFLLSVCWLG